MSERKITISIESRLLREIDRLVEERVFASRSQVFQSAIDEKVSRVMNDQFARECEKLDKSEERSWAELGLVKFDARKK